MTPIFADTHEILGWMDIFNTQMGVQMTYPEIWLCLAPLGIRQPHWIIVAVVMIIMFYASTCFYIGRLNFKQGLYYALALCSPALMLLVERGNFDMLMYGLIFAALVGIRNPRINFLIRLGFYALILIAGFFKMLPIFAIFAAFREKKKDALFILSVMAVVFGVYFLIEHQQLLSMRQSCENNGWVAFGVSVIFFKLNRLVFDLVSDGLFWYKKIFAYIELCLWIACGVGIVCSLRRAWNAFKSWLHRPMLDEGADSMRGDNSLDGFRVSAAMYLGTYMIGWVHDFKFAFCLFGIPWMIKQARLSDAKARIHTGALLAWLSTLYLGASTFLSLDEMLNIILFCYYAYFLTQTLPAWVKGAVHRLMTSYRRVQA